MDRHARGQRQQATELGELKAPQRAHFDVYQTITNRIVERIEGGVVPWQSASIARVGCPRNFATGKF